MPLKNQKIKMHKTGSEITFYRGEKSNGLSILPNTDVQIPKARQRLRANPGGAINNQICKANLDYSIFSRMRTAGVESRAKGFLVNKNQNKKILLRDGGAMENESRCSVFGIQLGTSENQPVSIEDLPQDKIKELMKKLSEIRKKKYVRCKERRYGNLNKGFTEEFFKCCKNSQACLAFKIMALLGLRVGEVVVVTVNSKYLNSSKIYLTYKFGGKNGRHCNNSDKF